MMKFKVELRPECSAMNGVLKKYGIDKIIGTYYGKKPPLKKVRVDFGILGVRNIDREMLIISLDTNS